MTICVAVKVPDGLVLATDSRATIVDRVGNVVNFSDNAEKIVQLRDYPAGLFFWGLSGFAQTRMDDLLREFSNGLPSLHGNRGTIIDVGELANQLFAVIKPRYESLSSGEQLQSGVLLGGYSTGTIFPDFYVFESKTESLHELSPPVRVLPDFSNGQTQFGVRWFGQGNPISRLLHGADETLLRKWEQWWYDSKLKEDPRALSSYEALFPFPILEVNSILEYLKYRLLCEQMPLQDAVDLAVYLINVVIGRHRFWFFPPTCGGEIDVAVIRKTGFEWIRRKTILR